MKPILLISASDSSSAAGMQVDLRVAQELGFPARCAVTALTVQGDAGVMRIDPADPDAVELAIRTALSDEPGIAAVKVGLVPESRIVWSIASALSEGAAGIPVVVDPVIRSTSGSQMADNRSGIALCDRIVPLGAILTPNRDELAALSKAAGAGTNERKLQAMALIDIGAGAILVTGGDSGEDPCVDLLFSRSGDEPARFSHPRVGGQTPRGTGCALSTALAAFLASGMELEEAVGRAVEYVHGKIQRSVFIGKQRMLFGGGGRF
ncbi:MAG: bifunctional hydroxymethylpyrimidine kinase/phosphomethylpyrimidine kinase [bacterium]|nr:bifunctional hydroxymethylpyrimidine kinase/phosphomethylpyrimidine kinase [bacterium]